MRVDRTGTSTTARTASRKTIDLGKTDAPEIKLAQIKGGIGG